MWSGVKKKKHKNNIQELGSLNNNSSSGYKGVTRSWLRHDVTSWKVAGWSPEVIEFFKFT
jgi:hypothetical protein